MHLKSQISQQFNRKYVGNSTLPKCAHLYGCHSRCKTFKSLRDAIKKKKFRNLLLRRTLCLARSKRVSYVFTAVVSIVRFTSRQTDGTRPYRVPDDWRRRRRRAIVISTAFLIRVVSFVKPTAMGLCKPERCPKRSNGNGRE